ncbi:uncharacterized protein JCM6883_001690 [Sporobolomyces salmoneus]|uniref:uncharacterized protein n=1 Tax=Sporobolomyces salmoneus TaxID=183962 RepID=UPI00316E3008
MVKGQLVGPCTATEINEYLSVYVPSNNSSARGKHFTVKANKTVQLPPEDTSKKKDWIQFMHDAVPYETELIENCGTIADWAPTRGSKVKGTLSQKQLREMEHAKFHHRVKVISLQHGLCAGKWIAFLNGEFSLPLLSCSTVLTKYGFRRIEDEVDDAWHNVVRGIADPRGHLAQLGVDFAKVSATRSDTFPHMLFVYLKDSYDDATVESAFRILVEQCGFAPTSYKTSAMDILGITSSHETKIAVSLYGKHSFMDSAQVKQALLNYAEYGPANAISPLQGPPPLPEIDWAFEFVPDKTQTHLTADGAGIESHDFVDEEPPVRTTRSRAKRIKLEEESEPQPQASSSKVKVEDLDVKVEEVAKEIKAEAAEEEEKKPETLVVDDSDEEVPKEEPDDSGDEYKPEEVTNKGGTKRKAEDSE